MGFDILQPVDNLHELSANEQVRAEYEQRQKAWCDRMSAMEGAREDAREDARKEIAKNALVEGASIDFVRKITGLEIETIKRLQAN
jgi:predicted transposase/invertase (TIGR01784 family)